MSPEEARERFAGARVARLATLGPAGPHLVPVTFALENGVIWTAVDEKPKATRSLQRLRNIATDPRVSLLADEYRDEDWSRLWWARADGRADLLDDAPDARALLVARYTQYESKPPAGPFLRIVVTRWSGWSYA